VIPIRRSQLAILVAIAMTVSFGALKGAGTSPPTYNYTCNAVWLRGGIETAFPSNIDACSAYIDFGNGESKYTCTIQAGYQQCQLVSSKTPYKTMRTDTVAPFPSRCSYASGYPLVDAKYGRVRYVFNCPNGP